MGSNDKSGDPGQMREGDPPLGLNRGDPFDFNQVPGAETEGAQFASARKDGTGIATLSVGVISLLVPLLATPLALISPNGEYALVFVIATITIFPLALISGLTIACVAGVKLRTMDSKYTSRSATKRYWLAITSGLLAAATSVTVFIGVWLYFVAHFHFVVLR